MADAHKLLYIIVQDVAHQKSEKLVLNSFRYTRSTLQSTLQLLGCKARHAFKISKRVFEVLREEFPIKVFERKGSTAGEYIQYDFSRHLSDSEIDNTKEYSPEDIRRAAEENEVKLKEISKKLYDVQQKRSTIVLNRDVFMDVVCNAMSEYRYLGPNQRNDFYLASKIREKKSSVTIMLCGTSGCGKSTLSTLLASRLGITTVISTDSIRHMMRSFVDEKDNPLLYASTYSAGEHLDPAAVAEAKARKTSRRYGKTHFDNSQLSKSSLNGIENGHWQHTKEPHSCAELDIKGKAPLIPEEKVPISSKTMAVQGYKAQSEMVIDNLDRLITSWEQKCESVIVEGVHLSLNFVMGLMKKHPSILPFMVYIANEEKHLERFAVRAKYMTLDPAKNKYVQYIRNIRAIQDYLCKRADKYLIPKVNNTNMDQSVASIHATIFGCLRKREAGDPFYDESTNTVKLVDDEFKHQCAANSLGSKGMLQLIRRRGSAHQLMALVNDDGSVAKTWPFESADSSRSLTIPSNNFEEYSDSSYNCDALEVSPVNLQFGNFGLSAWQNEMGGTSHSGSVDGLSSRGDGGGYQSSHRSSHHGSSCSSSPLLFEGAEKELSYDNGVSGSDEEQDDEDYAVDADSEEEVNDVRDQQIEDQVEGSVGDQSCASEEEDEYAETDDLEDNGEDKRDSNSPERKDRNMSRNFSDNCCRLQYFKHQNANFLDSEFYIKPAHRTHRQAMIKSTGSDAKVAEANGKHVHFRSKSLPLLTNLNGFYRDDFHVTQSRKRV